MNTMYTPIIYTVTELNSVLNQTLTASYPEIIVEAEVANFKINQNKWVFFDLKDKDSVINCFMSIYQLTTPIEDGMMLRVYCSPKLTNWGKFSLTIRAYELSGEGSVKKAFDLLKQKLEHEGLFLNERKRPLPQFVSKIALITSSTAAAYNDFVSVLNIRWGGVEIDHINVQVQGEAAASQIASAIDQVNDSRSKYDCIVIIRGGGSPEDLQAFNDEQLVRSVYASKVPTLAGIGHEDDITLVDLVADVRAATPTDAARILVPDKQEFINNIDLAMDAVYRNLIYCVQSGLSKIDKFSHIVALYCDQKIQNINNIQNRLLSASNMHIQANQSKVAVLSNKLETLDPHSILARGYAIVRAHSKTIKQADELSVGQNVVIQLNKGYIKAKVEEITNEQSKK